MIIVFMKGGLIALSVLRYDLLFADLLTGDLAQTIGRVAFILIFGGITELYVKNKIVKNKK